jgi:NodT family efflux transporter outer membrane factor (OMF) lipoprotein
MKLKKFSVISAALGGFRLKAREQQRENWLMASKNDTRSSPKTAGTTGFKIGQNLIPLFAFTLLTSCAVGPDYVRPTFSETTLPDHFQENWKLAQPQDQTVPQKWWAAFNDPTLTVLIEQVAASNQTLAQAEANYRAANALLDNAKAAYFPSLSANVSKTRSRSKKDGVDASNTFNLASSWEIDVWGGLRRAGEAQKNTMLSNYANVQAVRLSMQSQLAQTYFQLRALDTQQVLLDRSVAAYQRALTLTQNKYRAGTVASSDVLQAEAQLKSTEAQALDTGILRAQYEHAIATLIGQPASSFSLSSSEHQPTLPDVPVTAPSELLERRPDIAAAERLVAAANAQIGVTQAAYFPTLTLGASGGYQSSALADWLTLPNRIWSVGPNLAATLFDGGAKSAQHAQAIAAYDASVANYRLTVLTAFQNVEDNLAALRILKDEATVQHAATTAARKALDIAMNQYQAGTVDYLNVIVAQTTALANQRAELVIANSRLIAAVQLIVALGGGWVADDR